MKKSEHSYKNLYQRPDSSGKPNVPLPGRMSTIEGRTERTTKESQALNGRRDALPPSGFNSLASHSSKQFHSSKENDPRLTNRPATLHTEASEANLKQHRSREFKLYTEMDVEESKYKEKAQRLQLQLQRKLSDSGFLGFFKTANTSSYSHVDIYLQLMNTENMLSEKSKEVHNLQKRYSQAQREIEELLECREKSEMKFRAHTEQIRTFTQLIDRMQQKLNQKEGGNDQRYNQLKMLFDELQKQRVATLKRIKEVEDELTRQHQSHAKEIEARESDMAELRKAHAGQLESLAERLKAKQSECAQLSGANSQLRNRCEGLSSESESLTTSVRDLQEQLQSEQTHSVQTQLELQNLREAVKDLEEENSDLKEKVNELQEIKTKLHSQTQKKAEYKALVSEHMAKEKKLEERLQSSKMDIKKIESLLASSEEAVNKLKADMASQKSTEKQLRENLTRHEYQAKMLVDDKKRLEDLIGRLECDLAKQAKAVENYQSVQDSNSLRLQEINEKRQSNERVKTVGKIRQMAARLRLYLPEGFEVPPGRETEDLEKSVAQLSCIVSALIGQHLNPLRKQVQSLTIAVKTMQLEKECRQEGNQLATQSREEAIRVLLKFVPEESVKLVEEYLSVVSLSDCKSETISRKVALLQAILKEADRSRTRISYASSEQSTKRSVAESHRKPLEPPQCPAPRQASLKRDKEVNREVLKKYFE